MTRTIFASVVALVLWIAWCILVITRLVPHIRLHIIMWEWFMSYVLCLAPVLVLAAIAIGVKKPV